MRKVERTGDWRGGGGGGGGGGLVICFAGCEYLCFSVLTYCMIYLTTATIDGGKGGGDLIL